MASKVGLKDLFFAKLLTDEVDGTATYATPVRIAKAITAALEPIVSEAESFADDQMDDYYSAITGYDVTLDVNDLTPEKEALLLGKQVDKNGAVFTTTEDDAPYGALMFRALRSDGSYEYRVVYKVRFTPTGENYGTKADSVTFQNPQITAKSLARDCDGRFGNRVVSNDTNAAAVATWFDAPYEFAPITRSMAAPTKADTTK